MNHLTDARYARLTRTGELDTIEIDHPRFQAAFTLQGAHLFHFAPTANHNWLWLSPTARFETGRAIRGGIPICWPWFGDPARNPEAVRARLAGDDPPAHGFARTASWRLAKLRESETGITAALALEPSGQPGLQWRGQARVTLTFHFRHDSLSLELTTENTGAEGLALTQALHTYLPVADVSLTTLTGLEGSTYLDTLANWQPVQQQGAVRFTGETDRIYQSAPPIHIRTGERESGLTARGSRSTVVWNPGPDKARRLSDFPDDGWASMLCVETANAADDFRELAPGQGHTLGMTLRQRCPAG